MTTMTLDMRELTFDEIDFVSGADKKPSAETVGAAVGGAVGAVAGSAAGAAGTAVGGMVGALVGAYIAINWKDLAEMQAANRTPL